jgi:hypothetical protein
VKTKLATPVVTLVLALGALVGCGGNSGEDSSQDPTSAEPSEPDASEPSSDPAMGGDVDAFCTAYLRLSAEGDEPVTVAEGVEQMASLVDSAPPDIMPQATVVAENFALLTDAIEATGVDVSAMNDTSALTDAQEKEIEDAAVASGFDSDAYSAAGDRITVWADANCEAPGGATTTDVTAFCSAYTQLNGDISPADSVDAYEQLVASAPARLRDEAELAQTGTLAILDAVTTAGFDVSVLEDPAGLTETESAALTAAIRGAGVDTVAYEKATGTMDKWATDNC